MGDAFQVVVDRRDQTPVDGFVAPPPGDQEPRHVIGGPLYFHVEGGLYLSRRRA